ncbi:MAG: hypothetical protein IKE31_08770 [Eubacterium sp.]|nr:hypothetical protein [Eubacterium sp.]
MKLEVEYTINEGLSLWDGRCGILLDYIFDNEVKAWSDMPDICRHRMETGTGEFGRNHFLLFTHAHCDHYSKAYVAEYCSIYTPRIYGLGVPESNLPVMRPEPGVAVLEVEGYRILMFQTKHQGNGPFAEVANSILCIGSGNDWYVSLGDSVLSRKLLTEMQFYGVTEPEAVFSNLYQIYPESQRNIVKAMNARHNYCIHFPFRQNDEFGICKQITRFIEKSDDPFLKKMMVPEPMSRIL